MVNKACIQFRKLIKQIFYKLLPYLNITSCFKVTITGIVEYVFPAQDHLTSSFSFLQTQLSPWVWYSSWYLFSAHHTHSFTSMWLAPSAGKDSGFTLFKALMDTTSSCVNNFYSVVFA